ncbi:hypothetical protein BJY24_003553 [Nocardia transvalensis]|uniref:Uncharacterized protein n=1 Tax=Nocardia transvalensis TaxID=37333 RepID=A0A7W9UIW3_9NOCA|nr:hypothetical protein [Nocardia transvalensis]MBB5914686.1 hypothetical protein [Nocardia transvalensis]
MGAADGRVGEAVGGEIDLELLVQEGGAEAGGGHLTGGVGGQFAAGVGDRAPGEFADGAAGVVGQVPDAALAEYPADRAAGGPADRGLDRVADAELVGGAVALGDLEQAGAEVDAALLERAPSGLDQCGAGGGLERGAGQHSGDQLPDRHPDGYLRGDSRRRADGRTHTRQRPGHLGGRDDHRRDDHQLGVLDVVGAVVEQFGLLLAPFDHLLQCAVFARQLLTGLVEGVVGLSGLDRAEDRAHQLRGVVLEAAECGRRLGPAVGDAAHGRLVALGPITRAQHPFRNPLQ